MKTLKTIFTAFFAPVTTAIVSCLRVQTDKLKSVWTMRALTICTILLISGCGASPNRITHVTPKATGGGGGIVEMSYEVAIGILSGTTHVNWDAAQANAVKRCKAWGYSGASRFDAQTQKCIVAHRGDCFRVLYTAKYQCTK